MNWQRLVVGLVIGFAMLGASAAQAAPILIDDFQTFTNVSQIGPGTNSDSPGTVGSHLGTRVVSVTQGAGTLAAAISSMTIAGGIASFTTATDTDTVSISMEYTGFGSLDLSSFSEVLMRLRSFDSDGNPLSITMELFDGVTAESNAFVQPGVDVPVPGFDISFALNAFTSVDLTNITRFTFTVFGTNVGGTDDAIDGTFGGDDGIRIQEIPEPSTLALLGLASLGMAVYGRRKVLAKRVA